MPSMEIPMVVNMKVDSGAMMRRLEDAIENGEIRLELVCGGEVASHAAHGARFTIDKRKYRLRLSDETEESVKVWIEPKE